MVSRLPLYHPLLRPPVTSLHLISTALAILLLLRPLGSKGDGERQGQPVSLFLLLYILFVPVRAVRVKASNVFSLLVTKTKKTQSNSTLETEMLICDFFPFRLRPCHTHSTVTLPTMALSQSGAPILSLLCQCTRLRESHKRERRWELERYLHF